MISPWLLIGVQPVCSRIEKIDQRLTHCPGFLMLHTVGGIFKQGQLDLVARWAVFWTGLDHVKANSVVWIKISFKQARPYFLAAATSWHHLMVSWIVSWKGVAFKPKACSALELSTT